MNWAKYLADNCQISDASDLGAIRRAVDLAALSLQFKYGWHSYTVLCSAKTLHFMYTTDQGLFTSMIPVQTIVKSVVVKPVLEDIVKMHCEAIPSYLEK